MKIGIHLITQQPVAVKILEKSKIQDSGDLKRVTRELLILKKLAHPNLIQLYEIIETGANLYLIMEFAENGELFQYIVKNKRYSTFIIIIMHPSILIYLNRLSEEEAARIYY